MPIAAETIYDLIRELGADTCAAYSECFKKMGADKLKRRGFDPKTLLVHNLQMREWPDMPKGKFWLGDDGAGDHWFVEPGDREGKVWIYSPAMPQFESADVSLREFLGTAEQMNPIETEGPAGGAYLARTKVPGESILDPIVLEDWIRFVHEHPSLKYSGARIGTNPFTREEMRFEAPGLAVGSVGDRDLLLELRYGRIHVDRLVDGAKPLVQQIAGALGCHLTVGPPADEDDGAPRHDPSED